MKTTSQTQIIKTVLFVFFVLCTQANSLFAQWGPSSVVAPHIKSPTQLSLVDLDGDGYDDILASANGESEIGWFKNLSGTGEFSAFKPIRTQNNVGRNQYPYDWDGDGDFDIFTVSASVDKILYYENISGEGEFAKAKTALELGFSSFNAIEIQIADIENDGDNDMFIFDSQKLRLFRNTGPGFDFTTPVLFGPIDPDIFTLGDIDNDNDIDVVFHGTPSFTEGRLIIRRYDSATHTFLSAEEVPVANPFLVRNLGLADFNNDGKPDLYLNDNISNIIVYLNDNGTFNDYEIVFNGFGDTVDDLEAGDMDGDGDKDLLFFYNKDEILWFKNLNGQGNFSDEIFIWEGGFGFNDGWQALVGMLNQDNYPDIVVSFMDPFLSGEINWFEGTAQQTNLEYQSLYFQDKTLKDWGIADMNNDGKMDLVACSPSNQVSYLFLEDGVENPYHYPINIASIIDNFSLVDFDQDGDIDLLGSNADQNWIGWLENDGLNFIAHPISTSFYGTFPTDIYPVEPIDMDGDEDLDVFVYRSYTSSTSVGWYENTGNGQVSPVLNVIYQDGQGAMYDVLPIDIDADNDLDFVLTANNPGRMIFVIKSNIHNGYDIQVRNLEPEAFHPGHLQGTDIDSDGDIDFVFATEDGVFYWIENNGADFTFPDLHFIIDESSGVFGKGIQLEDMNNDGIKDLIYVAGSRTRILQNDGNGNFTSFFLIQGGGRHCIPFDIDRDGDLDLGLGGGEDFIIRKNYATSPRITGTVYWDENNNGQFDTLEIGLSQHPVLIEPRSLSTWPVAQGAYTFSVDPDAYELRCVPANSWVVSSDSVVYITIQENAMDTFVANFGVRPDLTTTTSTVHLSSSATRCGFRVRSWINYQANSYKRTEGVVALHLDTLAQFLSATPAPDTVTDSVLIWNFSNLNPIENQTIALDFQIAGVEEIGSWIDMVAIMDITEADTIVARDTFLHRSIIACGYDPNDKQVYPAIEGFPNYTLPGDELIYTVRFENTGLDTAFNVFIEDQLDADLLLSSFRLVGASHPVRTTLSETGLLTFYFDDILLPHTGIDPVGSHGFVSYAISAPDSIELNEYVLNKAGIFFDFNPPIITNSVSNIFVEEYPVDFDVVQSSCAGSLDGQITADFFGDAFTYYWNNMPGEPVLDSLGSGTYNFSLYRFDGALVNTSTVTLSDPPELALQLSSTTETNFQADGTASVGISGGTPPYGIRWSTDPPAEGETIEGLASGTYEVTVTDANGCEKTGSVFLDLVVQTDTPIGEAARFTLFPNPTNNQLWISSASVAAQDVTIAIYNLHGQLLKNEAARIANRHAIDVAALPSAIYWIKIFEQGKPVFTSRFTVIQ